MVVEKGFEYQRCSVGFPLSRIDGADPDVYGWIIVGVAEDVIRPAPLLFARRVNPPRPPTPESPLCPRRLTWHRSSPVPPVLPLVASFLSMHLP